jgi:hypothetical protein
VRKQDNPKMRNETLDTPNEREGALRCFVRACVGLVVCGGCVCEIEDRV